MLGFNRGRSGVEVDKIRKAEYVLTCGTFK
jgi:hypothetical protein